MSKYSCDLLVKFCDEHGIILAQDYEKEHFHADLRVECRCLTEGCEESASKLLYKLIKDGFIYCKACSYQNRRAKTEATNLNKYGVKNPMQNNDVKQKLEATNLKKYGVARPAQNEQVMAKMTATTRAKYDCDNAMQCEDVKKKQQAVLEQKYGVTNPRHIAQTPKPESTRYNHKRAALEDDGCEVLTSADDLEKTETFRFRCREGHETEQKYTSLNNRIAELRRGDCRFLCGKCCLRQPVLEKLEARLKELGFELVSLGDDNLTVEYRCRCGQVSKTNTKNLHKASRQSTCNKCGNTTKAEARKALIATSEVPKGEKQLDLPNGFQCLEEGCTDYAYLEGVERPLYCGQHSDSKRWFTGYKSHVCIAADCPKKATYNFREGQRRLFCLDHKQEGMVNVNSVKCTTCKEKPARFNSKAMYCRLHRGEDMVDCLEKLCDPPECWRQGTFAFNRFDKKVVCKEHRQEGMKDVKNVTRVCEFTGCEKQANYNFSDTKRAVRCKEHKELGMVDKYHDCCVHEDCFSRSVYNYENEVKGTYCVKHKKDGMMDVVSDKCQHEECNKQACFNFAGQFNRTYCDRHKLDGMVDVKNRNCKVDGGCIGQAMYGFIGEKACRCRLHSEKGMMKYPNRRCDQSSCKNSAQYGFEGCFPVYCEIHHDDEQYVNLVEQVCNSCRLMNILRDGLCLFCNPASKREVLKKQNDVRDWLQANGYRVLSCDKRIDGGVCGKERPDFVLETECGFFVVIEVDEFQHFSYAFECENTRMINISQSLGSPTMFIRFNPDKYTVGKSKQNVRLADRYKILKKWLDNCLETSIEAVKKLGFCNQVKLFYNEFNDKNCEWETLLAFEK